MPHVNLISWNNTVGLGRDIEILAKALISQGMEVTCNTWGRGKLRKLSHRMRSAALGAWHRWRGPRYDLTIMLEHARPEYLPWAKRNIFIPNPEFCKPSDISTLSGVDMVLAKTREAERIFTKLGVRTKFIGFTSPDRLDRDVERNRTFFHLAGRSSHKGTEALLALWRTRPHWPMLTVVQSPRTARPNAKVNNVRHLVDHIPDDELRRLQNANLFHLCPSATEGFGHYLVEAMSVGAVTLTLDAAPMNELVNLDRGILVAAHATGTRRLASTHGFEPAFMAEAIERMIAMDAGQIARVSSAARAWYELNAKQFAAQLAEAVKGNFSRDG